MKHHRPSEFVPATRPSERTGLRKLASRTWQTYFRWLARQAARRALLELDDRMLKDIGVSRGEIEAIVRGHVPHRQSHCPPPGLG